jgi:hypothetical protein
MLLKETYSTVQVGKHFSDMFPVRNGLKQGDVLTPMLFNFDLGYAIRTVQVKQDGLKFSGTHYWFMLMKLIYWLKEYML